MSRATTGFLFQAQTFPTGGAPQPWSYIPYIFSSNVYCILLLQAHVIGNMASLEIISRRQLLGGAQSSSRTEEPRNSFVPRLP